MTYYVEFDDRGLMSLGLELKIRTYIKKSRCYTINIILTGGVNNAKKS